MATDHNFKIKNGLEVENGFLLIGKSAYSTSDAYMGIKTSNMSGVNDYMMISGTGDNNTYISAKAGASVIIRSGGNTSTHQLTIGSGGAAFDGNVTVAEKTSIAASTSTSSSSGLKLHVGTINSTGSSAIAQFGGFIRASEYYILHENTGSTNSLFIDYVGNDLDVRAGEGSYTGVIRTNGYKVGTTTVIDSSRNIMGAGINSTANYTELGTTTASNLVFKRTNASYIQADGSGGYFIFITNGRSTSYANRALALTTDNNAEFGGAINTVGNVTVGGNLTVNGTTTTLNTATLQVEDKNIVLNYASGDTSSTADGAGITIQDAVNSSTDATILWDATNDRFRFSHWVDVAGNLSAYHIYGQDHYVLNAAADGWHRWAQRSGGKVNLDVNTISSSSITASSGMVVTDISSTGRGIYRNNTGYDLRVGGGTNSGNGAYISMSGETRGGSNSAYNGRIEYYSGGTGFANQAAILGDHVWYAKHAGGSANLMALDSATGDLNLKLGDFEINGTTVIDTSRNLTNIANISATGPIRTNDGSQSAPAYSFSNDTNTGMYRNSDDILGFATGGARRGYFASSGIHSDANVYAVNDFRNYGGAWIASTGLTGNGFSFINSVDGTAMTLSSTGDMTVTNHVAINNFTLSADVALGVRGQGTSGSKYIFSAQDSGGSTKFYVRDDGVTVVQSGGYLYVTASGGAYFTNSIKARGGIKNDQGDLTLADHVDITSSGTLKIAGTQVISSSRALTNITSINATGAIETVSQLASYQGNVSNSFANTSIRLGYSGSASYQQAIKSRHNSGTGAGNAIDFFLWNSGTDAVGDIGTLRVASFETSKGLDIVDGGLQIDGTTVVTSLRNLTNVGTISSGGITTSSHIDFTTATSLLRNLDDNSGQIGIQVKNSGGTAREVRWDAANNTNGAWRATTNGAADLGLTNKIWNNLFVNTIKVGTSNLEVIDSSRNITAGTISSGAITSSGKLTLSGTEDEILTLNSTDNNGVYMSFERAFDRHGYVGFGGSNDLFSIVNEESGGSVVIASGNVTALTLSGTNQNAVFAGNITSTTASGSSFKGPVYITAQNSSGEGGEISLSGSNGNTSHTLDTVNGTFRIFDTGGTFLTGNTGYGLSTTQYRVAGTIVISSSRGLQNVTLQGGIAGARFQSSTWIYDDDNDGRLYFATNGLSYYKSTSGHRFRANGDITRVTIDAAGAMNLVSGGDTNAPGGAALAVAGTEVLSTDRVLQNVSVDTTTSIAPAIRGTVAGVDNTGYVHAFKVDGGNLSSQIRFTVGGTVGSVVFSNDVSVVCNHYRDILIESTSGFYTILTVKVVSNGNEDFSVFFKSNSANTATVNIVVFPLNDEVVTITTTDPSYSGRTLEHTCDYGKKFSATNNATPDQFDITTDGDIDANKYQISGTTVIGADRTVRAANGSVASPTISFSADTDTGLYRYGTNQLGFVTAGAYRGMFDNSGNFIVGGTSNVPGAGNAATGVSLYNDGRIFAAKDGNTVMSLNRNSNNGVIAEFRYAGNLIGNMGVEGGDSLFIQSDGATGGGLRFHQNGVISPVRNGAVVNNTIDLGTSTQQFRELYLGSGLYMGGTQIVNSSRNLTNIGTISSGNITAGNSSTAASLRAHYNDGSYMTLVGYGLEMNRGASYIRPTTDGDKTLYIGGADDSLDWNAIHFRSVNGLYMSGTKILDSSRNLTNVTASGDIITSVTTTDDASWHDVVIYSSSGLRRDTAVEVHGAGYLRASYLNMSHSAGTRTGDTIFYSSNDDYIRKSNASGFRTSLDVYSKAESVALFTDTGDIDLGAGSVLTRSNHHTGHMEGSYNNIGANGSKSNPIFTIGYNYNPTESALSNMYGIGYAKGSQASFLSSTLSGNWGMYVASGGIARIFLDAGGGVVRTTSGYNVGSTNVIDSSRNLVNIASITASGNMSITGELKSTNAGTNAIKTRFISGAASGSTSDGNLYIQHAKTNNILCFNGTSGNPQFLVYGNDGGTQRSGTLQVGTDGSFNITASDTYLLLNAGSYVQSNKPHNFTQGILFDGTSVINDSRHLQNVTVTAGEAEYGQSLNGNFGQWQAHNAYNAGFNTDVDYWGWNYINSNTNAPHTASAQWYRNRVSLGNAYGHGVQSGDYWLEMAYPRYGSGSTPGHMYIRTCESGTIGSWYEVGAHLRGNLNVGTNTSADINLGSTSTNARLIIKKADNNVPDHIQIFCGGTQTGEIGSQDTTWLRINQSVAKNIYTPRYIRADSGFFVDGGTMGIDGSGRLRAFAGSNSSVGIGFVNDPNTGLFSNGADNIGFATNGTNRVNLSTAKLALLAGLGLDLETSSGNVRGLIGAFETTPHLRIATSNNENIGFYDGGTSGTCNVEISGGGALTVRSDVTAFGNPSDIRLKENIEIIPDAIEKVQKLEGITFNYKKDGSRSTGLIAQQLQEVLPEVVYEAKDLDTQETHYAVRYGNVVGLLVEAIKEQQTQLTAQQEQINQLTNLVNTLMEK